MAVRAAGRAPAQHDAGVLRARPRDVRHPRAVARGRLAHDGTGRAEPASGTHVEATFSPDAPLDGEWITPRRLPTELADLTTPARAGGAPGRRLDARRPTPGVRRSPPGAPDAVDLGRPRLHRRSRRAGRPLRRGLPRRGRGGRRPHRCARERLGSCSGVGGIRRLRSRDAAHRLSSSRARTRASPARATFHLAATVEGRRIDLAEVDGRFLSSETAESFTGRVIGLYAREDEWMPRAGSPRGTTNEQRRGDAPRGAARGHPVRRDGGPSPFVARPDRDAGWRQSGAELTDGVDT